MIDRSIQSPKMTAARIASESWCEPSASSPEHRYISVVMPCLDEAETLAQCILEAQESLKAARLTGEIIVADNGSVDGSLEIAEALGAKVVRVAEKGYGSALHGGIAASSGNIVIMGDADASYSFSDLPKFIAKLGEGFDVVVGNRFRGGIEPGAMPWSHRLIGNPALSTVGRLFFGCPIGDFHCGLRAIRRSAFDELHLNTTGMEYASEMIIKATLGGLRIGEIPTVLRPAGRSRPPHLRTFRDGWRHLRFMLLFCPRWLFMVPGGMLVAAGLFCQIMIAIRGGWRLGGVELSVNTAMASAMFIWLGHQLLWSGTAARQIGMLAGHFQPMRMARPLRKWLSLEGGIVSGAVLFAAGIGLLSLAWNTWRQANFGALDTETTVRYVVPSVTLAVLGAQVVFGSFLLNALRFLGHARTRAAEESALYPAVDRPVA